MIANKKKVLYIVEDEGSAQFRYRVHNLEQLFEGDYKWEVKHRFVKANDNYEMIKEADLVIIERQSAKRNDVLKLIDIAHKQEKKVVFDLDDLIFDYRDLLLLMNSTNSKNILYWLGYFWGIRRIAKRVDGFLCTNEFLAKKIRRSFNEPVKVIQNSLNKEQFDASDKCLKEKTEKKKGFEIGYFSGSPTHVKDFLMIEPELVSFMDKYDDVSLLVVGYMELSKQMKDLFSSGRVKTMQPVNYLKLQKLMSKVDVNIAPLVLNDFTNCKSELKYFEAAIVETTTIASPNYSFSHAIKNGENGFLAKNGEWVKMLEYLYNNRGDNKRVAKKAKADVLKNYYGNTVKEKAKEAYEFFAK